MDKELVKLYKPFSYLVMAALALLTFASLSFLPETKGVPTQDTHEDEEKDKTRNDVELAVKSNINDALDTTD